MTDSAVAHPVGPDHDATPPTHDGGSSRPIVPRDAYVWTLLAITVLGAVMRYLIAQQDLFADELATYWVVSAHGVWGVVRTVSTTAEISPPLSFVLSWLTTRVSLDPMWVRLPALVCGIATIPLVYAVGVRTVGRRAALLAAALTMLSPFMLYYSAEARGYGLAMALVLLSTLSVLLASDTGRVRWWVLYGACICLAAYTHYTVVFVLAVQFVWAFWGCPRARRALFVATGAAVLLYLPWVPSLRGDLDSPTTQILNQLSPFDLHAVRQYLEHWSLGYPYSGPGRDLADLPGRPALLLLAVGLCLGAYGLFTVRSRVRERLMRGRGRALLVVLLAFATPVLAALVSTVGDHTFSTRNLAASWPYGALTLSALLVAGRSALRIVAAALAVVAFGLGAAGMFRTDFRRPQYAALARFANQQARGVVVDAAPFSPGPLTNFDVAGSEPNGTVFRLGVPEQKQVPFGVFQRAPDPADVARRAVVAAGDGPIIVVTRVSGEGFGLAGLGHDPAAPLVAAFLKALPKSYTAVGEKRVNGLGPDLQAVVLCPKGRPRCAQR